MSKALGRKSLLRDNLLGDGTEGLCDVSLPTAPLRWRHLAPFHACAPIAARGLGRSAGIEALPALQSYAPGTLQLLGARFRSLFSRDPQRVNKGLA